MERIGTFPAAEKKVLDDVNTLLSEVRSIVATVPMSATEGVTLLALLRDIGYEDLNQIQHEYLILAAVGWLIKAKEAPADVEWYWNPRQTGGANEPDLRGRIGARILVSAEITTSRRPIGTIFDRMKTTLGKLTRLPGKQFYFVRTESMRAKANAIVKANGWKIFVICLPTAAGDV